MVSATVISRQFSQGAPSLAIGGPFDLIASDGQPVTQASWPGKYLLVYFGYTYCPDVCPTTLSNVAGALDDLGAKADRLQPLFITVDPARDTPKVLAEYTAAFTKRLIGLSGSDAQIAQVAKEYRVYYAKHKTGPGLDDYLMDHSSVIYLMAPDGHLISVLAADQPPASLAEEISNNIS
jgi:protein SCO1/2